jgi:hypothetical protein
MASRAVDGMQDPDKDLLAGKPVERVLLFDAARTAE